MKTDVEVLSREFALLLLPVLFLAGLALSLCGKPGVVVNPAIGRFSLVVNEVKFKKLPPRQGEPQVEITVYVTYQGTEPKWWKKGASAQWLQNMRFVNQKGKEYSLFYHFGGSSAPYDVARQNHVLRYTYPVYDGYEITKSGYLKGTVVMANQVVPPGTAKSFPQPLKPLVIARFSVPVRLE